MLLEHCTWLEVEEYLGRSRGIIFPVGSVEQHGPTGLLGTDFICAQTIARSVGEAAGALVGPTISVGMSVHHLAFPGSITLRPSTLLLVVRDYVLSLVRYGFTRFFFLNGHGGNTPTLKAAFSEVQAELAGGAGEEDVRLQAVNWWEAPAVKEVIDGLFGDREGGHATASEISLTQWVLPDRIKTAPLGPYPSRRDGFHGPADFRRRYPDGRIASDPGLAAPEHGEKVFRAAVPALAGMYRAFLEEE
ncbi:MAG: creatininase family protein [Thermodesulfobacteriota bacterium]